MVKFWTEQIVFAKYHLSVAERLLGFYVESPEKRFFIGALNELSRSATNLINAVLMQAEKDRKVRLGKDVDKNFNCFLKIAGDYLEDASVVLKIMKIKSDHRKSPVHFDRGGKILFLIDGEYKALTVERLRGLVVDLKRQIRELKAV